MNGQGKAGGAGNVLCRGGESHGKAAGEGLRNGCCYEAHGDAPGKGRTYSAWSHELIETASGWSTIDGCGCGRGMAPGACLDYINSQVCPTSYETIFVLSDNRVVERDGGGSGYYSEVWFSREEAEAALALELMSR